MTTRPPIEALIKALEADPYLRGKRTAAVPEMAAFRFHFRRRFYQLAEFQFGGALFNLIIAAATPNSLMRWLNLAAFCLSFAGMFFCEFRARMFTRQLHRPAAEQLARDMLGIFNG